MSSAEPSLAPALPARHPGGSHLPPPRLPTRPLIQPPQNSISDGFYVNADPPAIPPRPMTTCAADIPVLPSRETGRRLPPDPFGNRPPADAPPPQRQVQAPVSVEESSKPPTTAMGRAQQQAGSVLSTVITAERKKEVRSQAREAKDFVQEASSKLMTKEREQQAMSAIGKVGSLGFKAFQSLQAKK